MARHLVVGAGMIGRPLAQRLADRGDTVAVGTRGGTTVAGADSVVLDASDSQSFRQAARGAQTIFVCTNPPYTSWPTDWPPIFEAAIDAASGSGARLVLMGNLYPYGVPRGPMTERTIEATTERKGLVRKAGWAKARAAHDRGDIRAVEVRASDYFGPGAAGTAHLGESFFTAILDSKTARVIGNPSVIHSWSYLPDIVTTLIAAADYTGKWGRIWHVPSPAVSRDNIARQLNERYGSRGRVVGHPQWLLGIMGAVNPMLREVWRSSYQFRVPFVIDARETQRELGVSATPWNEALSTTAESYREAARA